jgi:hypothetical protein
MCDRGGTCKGRPIKWARRIPRGRARALMQAQPLDLAVAPAESADVTESNRDHSALALAGVAPAASPSAAPLAGAVLAPLLAAGADAPPVPCTVASP